MTRFVLRLIALLFLVLPACMVAATMIWSMLPFAGHPISPISGVLILAAFAVFFWVLIRKFGLFNVFGWTLSMGMGICAVILIGFLMLLMLGVH